MKIENTDRHALGLFAKAAHWFQRLTGRTNYFLAKLALFVMGMALVIRLIRCFLWLTDPLAPWFDMEGRIVSLGGSEFTVLGACVLESFSCDRAERDRLVPQRAKSLFILRHASTPARRVGLFIFGWTVVPATLVTTALVAGGDILAAALQGIFLPAIAAYLYLVEVTPLPPERNTARHPSAAIRTVS